MKADLEEQMSKSKMSGGYSASSSSSSANPNGSKQADRSKEDSKEGTQGTSKDTTVLSINADLFNKSKKKAIMLAEKASGAAAGDENSRFDADPDIAFFETAEQ